LYANNSVPGRHSPAYWASGSFGKSKGKAKVSGLFTSRNGTSSRKEPSEHINYSELLPLDGEEGELIDDEACFIDVRAVTGMGEHFLPFTQAHNAYVITSPIDILSMLPPELALHVLSLVGSSLQTAYSRTAGFYLSTPISPGRTSAMIGENDTDHHEALKALLACRLVSRTWCRLASDNAVWRGLFLNRWSIDLGIASDPRFRTESFKRNVKSTLGMTWEYDMTDISEKAKRVLGLTSPSIDAPIWSAPLRLDWRMLYRERLELELRWSGSPCLPLDDSKLSFRHGSSIFDTTSSFEESSIQRKRYDPTPMRIAGHSDR
jgi:F-box and WD-40 domain protein 1/11